jgi:hypothetical protein
MDLSDEPPYVSIRSSIPIGNHTLAARTRRRCLHSGSSRDLFPLPWSSEDPGHWRGLVDLDAFITSYPPVYALENSAIKHEAAAYPAKSFASAQGCELIMEGGVIRHAWMNIRRRYLQSTGGTSWGYAAILLYRAAEDFQHCFALFS